MGMQIAYGVRRSDIKTAWPGAMPFYTFGILVYIVPGTLSSYQHSGFAVPV